MRGFSKILGFCVGLALLSGCAQNAEFTPQNSMCSLKRHRLATTIPGVLPEPEIVAQGQGQVQQPALPQDSMAGAISQTLAAQTDGGRNPRGEIPTFLFLSGGGQHGAFGAGFIDQWRKEAEAAGRSLPEFQMVTGISTGSIQASFAFTGRTENAVAGYTIDDEKQLITRYLTPSKDGGLGGGALMALAKQGALADLAKLRDHLDVHLTYQVLRDVAAGARTKRSLFIGAVDVDSGEAVAFDMVDMAQRFITAQPEDPQGGALNPAARKAKDCYIAAILASSSQPMAAKPVFIDNRMYMDGGARFGLFGREIGAVINDRIQLAMLPVLAGNKPPAVPITFAIVNGTLMQGEPAKCPWEDTNLCANGLPSGLPNSPHRKWNFIDLALRSEGILTNQIYRFSARDIGKQAGDCAGCFNMVRIEPDGQDHVLTLNKVSRTCKAWHEDDRKRLNPIQFFPNYMRCMIDYGRTRATAANWARFQMR